MPAGAAHSIPPGPNLTAKLDAADILASVGAALYHWDIESDALVWSSNVLDVLRVADIATISTGRRYAQLLDAANVQARFDAVMQTDQRDDGRGVFFQTEYCIRPDSGSGAKLWIEDSERHDSDSRLSYLAYHDGLTGELNRHQLTMILKKALEEAMRSRSSCGFLLVAIDNLGRINDSYGFDIADEVIGAVAKRIRGRMRGKDSLGRHQVRHRAQRMHAGRHGDRRRSPACRSPRRAGADRRRSGRRDRDDRRGNGAAARAQRAGGSGPREGGARRGEGQAAGLVFRLSA